MEVVDFKNKNIISNQDLELDENSNVVPDKFLVRKFIISRQGFEADKIVHKDGSMTLSLDQLWPGFLSIVEIQGVLEIRKDFEWNQERLEQVRKIPKSYLILDIELSSTKHLENALDLVHHNLDTLNLDIFNPETVFLNQIFPLIKSIPNINIVVHESTNFKIEDFKRSLDYISKFLKFSSVELFRFSMGSSVNSSRITTYEEHSFQINSEGTLKKRKTSWDLVYAF